MRARPRRARRLALVAAASLALAGPLVTPLARPPEAAASRAGTVVNHYLVPDDVLAARARCYRVEERRIEADHATLVPADRAGYDAWHAAGGPAVRAWADAVRACQHRHTQPGGIWNWSALILARSTTVE